MHNADDIHQRIAGRAADFLRPFFGERLRRSRGESWRVGRHGSLAITIKAGRLVFFDHELGEGGDGITLWAREFGVDNATAFKQCAQWCGAASAGSFSFPARRRPFVRPATLPYAMTPEEFARGSAAAQALAGNPALCARVANARQWKAETIARLAEEGSLGWDEGRLAFVYLSGIKQRWRADGERQFRFACGKAHTHWRASRRTGRTTNAIITEGETDAIALIDIGCDTETTLVLAVPSAGTWPIDWKRTLDGLQVVTFAMDNDEAGQRHVADWAEIIRPSVGSVRALDWKGVTE